MNPDRRQEIEDRYHEIELELAALWAGRVCCDPPEREADLLLEQEACELELSRIQSEAQ